MPMYVICKILLHAEGKESRIYYMKILKMFKKVQIIEQEVKQSL